MKSFIKNSYLFFLLFALLLSKNFIFSLFKNSEKVNYESMYSLSLEKEIENISLIKNFNYKDAFTYGKIFNRNIYYVKNEMKVICDSSLVKVGDLVLNGNYLIGKVKKVFDGFAIIENINNKNFIIQGKINDEYVILENSKNGLSFKTYNKYEVGSTIFVSNLMGYNENIIIGKIIKNEINPSTLENNYIIKTKNIDNNYVVILSKDNL